MKIQAIIHEAEEGGYWAEVPALPGCFTQGKTIEEIIENLKESAEGWIEAMNIPEGELDKRSQLMEFNL